MTDSPQYLAAVAKWKANEPMTPDEIGILKWDAAGDPVVADNPDVEMQAFLAKHGNTPVTFGTMCKWLTMATKVTADAIRPMRRRIEALEAEVRAGHERIKALEAANEGE